MLTNVAYQQGKTNVPGYISHKIGINVLIYTHSIKEYCPITSKSLQLWGPESINKKTRLFCSSNLQSWKPKTMLGGKRGKNCK